MQGEFRGDCTRNTFRPDRDFLQVFYQQGRVPIDADPNEQSSILIHYLQSLAVDLMGYHAAPFEGGGFEILTTLPPSVPADDPRRKILNQDGFIVSEGKYYVNGIPCRNDQSDTSYFNQPSPPVSIPTSRESPIKSKGNYLIYLDVWERHINYIQDEVLSGNNIHNLSIREVALGGVDTATRSQIVWHIKIDLVSDEKIRTAINVQEETVLDVGKIQEYSQKVKDEYNLVFLKTIGESIEHPGKGTGKLKARAKKTEINSTDPCIVNPSSSYRETENQLYRVEIHDGGDSKTATFKWSRENSSVVFPIRNLVISSGSPQTITITLADFGRDNRYTLEANDWVEIVDDDYIIQNNPAGSLFKVNSIDRDEQTIELKIIESSDTIQPRLGQNPNKHPFLRRWDRDEKTIEVAKDNNGVQAVEEGEWLLLENGIEIWFTKDSPASVYKKGDYWLIPARTATGDVEWPGTVDSPTPLPPHGIIHHYAPLALISVVNANAASTSDCRRTLTQQWQ